MTAQQVPTYFAAGSRVTQSDSNSKGLVFGLLVSVGLIATVSLNNYMFSGRPFRLFLIDLGYPVVALAMAGVILGVW